MTAHLAAHKMPGRWWLVETIPRTTRGKINRDQVKAACIDQVPLDLIRILA
jgi:acyl-coenzyme A synthetase/AMP-(fatty) acid ligase